MRVAVFGLGYVGATTTAALAELGHHVIALDIDETKAAMVAAGRSPVIEPGVDELLAAGVAEGRIATTAETGAAIAATELSLICVGTPSNPNGSLDTVYIERVCSAIGQALRDHSSFHVVAIRSTMTPGWTEELVIPTLEAQSGLRAGSDFGVCVNPEFLREGSGLADFNDPPFVLIGAADKRSASIVGELYNSLDAVQVVVPLRAAEMVKYASNAFHALKVTFANEIGAICKALNIDSHQVMDVFARDRRLNISDAYLRPGFAFGGSCLPKDLRALTHYAGRLDLQLPVLDAINPSNAMHVARAMRLVQDANGKRIGILGLSFKAGTDDLRESPIVDLMERLIGKGYELMAYDRNVALSKLRGANRAYIEREIPHIASLLAPTLDEVVAFADILVVGNRSEEFQAVVDAAAGEQTVIDLVRVSEDVSKPGYQGICW